MSSVSPESSELFDRLTRKATNASIVHEGFAVVPSIVKIVQQEYKKTKSGDYKKRIASALVKSVLPDSLEPQFALVDSIIDMVFQIVRDKELRKLLKKSCNCCK